MPAEFFENGRYDNDSIPYHIRGISCNVKNCAYHDGDGFCTADKIQVGPSYANCCMDTVCATFRPKEF